MRELECFSRQGHDHRLRASIPFCAAYSRPLILSVRLECQQFYRAGVSSLSLGEVPGRTLTTTLRRFFGYRIYKCKSMHARAANRRSQCRLASGKRKLDHPHRARTSTSAYVLPCTDAPSSSSCPHTSSVSASPRPHADKTVCATQAHADAPPCLPAAAAQLTERVSAIELRAPDGRHRFRTLIDRSLFLLLAPGFARPHTALPRVRNASLCRQTVSAARRLLCFSC